VILFWFSPWWIGGKNLAPLDIIHEMMQPWRGNDSIVNVKNHIVADAVDQYLIYRIVAAESYLKEGWVGWSSLTYGGTAQYANTMALYYDWTMQLHRWFSFWTAWHLGLMGQLILAASGMMLFLRNRSINSIWATCGAIAYAGNSQFVTWVYHRWALGAFCWVPWAFWAIDLYKSGEIRYWVLVPIFISLSFLGGTLQHGAIVVLAIAAFSIEELWKRGINIISIKQILIRYILWVTLAVGIASMMFLPCIDSYLISNRLGLHTGTYGNASVGFYPQGWSQPLLNILVYPIQFFPSLFGRCDSLDLLKLFKSELFYVAYFGSIPTILAYIAIFKKNTPKLSIIMMGLGLILPLTPVVRYLYQRLFILFILGGILAFSNFMTFSPRYYRRKLSQILLKISLFIIISWILASLFLMFKHKTLLNIMEVKYLNNSMGSSFGYFREWMQSRFELFLNDLRIWSPHQLIPLVLYITSLIGLRMSSLKNYNIRKSGEILIAVIVFIEITLFSARWVTFADPVKYPLYPVNQYVKSIKQYVKDGMTVTLGKKGFGHMAITPFVSNTLSAYGIKSISGYDSIVPNGMNLSQISGCSFDLCGYQGITHMLAYPGSTPNPTIWNMVCGNSSFVLYENRNPTPKYIGFLNNFEYNTFFNHTNNKVLTSLVESTHLENQRKIVVPEGVKIIRIAENYAKGWQYRAPDASMLLSLNNNNGLGSFTVEMRYEPFLRKLGFIVSGLSLVVTLAVGIVLFNEKSLGNKIS
jgi:hypothetical protein